MHLKAVTREGGVQLQLSSHSQGVHCDLRILVSTATDSGVRGSAEGKGTTLVYLINQKDGSICCFSKLVLCVNEEQPMLQSYTLHHGRLRVVSP